MNVLGVDPGATTGWCAYDCKSLRVLASGKFRENNSSAEFLAWVRNGLCDIVIERPVAHGPTRPQVVDCAWVAGLLYGALGAIEDVSLHQMTRLEIKQVLTDATLAEIRVKNDATAWAAVRLLHGEGCDAKGGAIHGVRSHERAALACAVAFALRIERISFVNIDKRIAAL
jgi:hypothetical protein